MSFRLSFLPSSAYSDRGCGVRWDLWGSHQLLRLVTLKALKIEAMNSKFSDCYWNLSGNNLFWHVTGMVFKFWISLFLMQYLLLILDNFGFLKGVSLLFWGHFWWFSCDLKKLMKSKMADQRWRLFRNNDVRSSSLHQHKSSPSL